MKLNKIALAIIFVLPILSVAGGSEHHDISMSNSDFFYRVLNFTIFAGLIYYLVANPIRDFFKNRSADIANRIKEIDAKLQESKNEVKFAEKYLAKSQEKAKEIIADAKEESVILAENIAKKSEEILLALEKQLEDKMIVEKKKMVKTTIKKLLEDGIESSDITIDGSKVVSLVSKKVA